METCLPFLAGLIKIDILKDGETHAGFVIYQNDDIDNEWHFKEGWGDIREIYVIPSLQNINLDKPRQEVGQNVFF